MTRRLIADIGGTNARFALVDPGAPVAQALHLPAARYPRFEDALEAALGLLPGAETAGEAAIAAAGPVADGEIEVTNLPWRIVAGEVSRRLGGARVRLLNDMEAVALALPRLGVADLVTVRAGRGAAPPSPLIAINVGTGFGAATAVPVGDDWAALASEPGHMRFAAATAAERQHLGHLQSVEDLLSGRGLAALYHRLGGAEPGLGPEGVFARAGCDGAAAAAVDLFAACLGRVAGDLVLATGAWGGAYLCGGLITAPRGGRFEAAFLRAFADKGAMADRIAGVPIHRIATDDPALRGLAAMPFRAERPAAGRGHG